MKTFELVFNNTIYTFNSSFLSTLYDCMVYNEQIDDDCDKYCISFLKEKFMKKTYDDLEFHEFLIDGLFNTPQLLCNLDNIFGQDKAREYNQLLSEDFEEDFEEDISDTVSLYSISASTAYSLAEIIFDNNELEKFKNLLAVMFLYDCAENDYEQTVYDIDEFDNLLFINGIGVHKCVQDDTIVLKPVYHIHDTDKDKYIQVAHVLVPPSILSAIFKTVGEGFMVRETKYTAKDFFLKFEQLTSCFTLKERPIPIKKIFGEINQNIVGKWYRIAEFEARFMPKYHILINWFKNDGTLLKAVRFVDNLDEYKDYEYWGPEISSWLANDNEILIKDAYARKDIVESYEINSDSLCIGDTTYYRTYDLAADNIVRNS